MNRLLVAVSLTALSSACSLNLCDRIEVTQTSLNEKVSGCTGNSSSSSTFNAESCSTEKCTSEDISAMNRYLDCLDALPTCTAATAEEFGSAITACAAKVPQLSAGCGGQ